MCCDLKLQCHHCIIGSQPLISKNKVLFYALFHTEHLHGTKNVIVGDMYDINICIYLHKYMSEFL